MNTSPWSEKKWKLQETTESIKVLIKDGASNIFRLKPTHDASKIVYYRLDFSPGEMADCWKECILFPRGLKPAPTPQPTLSATPTALEQLNAALQVSAQIAFLPRTTERLEGDILLGPNKLGAVTLYQAPNAIAGNKALLIVRLVTDDQSPGGTGAGGSVD
jgi:hypothetical protein